jgi:hypothetical protein
MDLVTVITSAAVGAIIAAGINFLGQLLERRARRKELLIAKAIEIAIDRTRMALQMAKDFKMSAEIPDSAVNAVDYYRMLEHLWDTGKLHPDIEKNQEESRRE